jgi:hypothetical protein
MSPSPVSLLDPLAATPATREQFLEIVIGYFILLGADYQAEERGLPAEPIPVECLRLSEGWIAKDVLLWMLYQGHVDHFVIRAAGARVASSRAPSAVVVEGSAFVLTPSGKAFAELLVRTLLLPGSSVDIEALRRLLRLGKCAPRYHREERLLAWGRYILKSFEQPSANQERILLAAEELGWAHWFDDPLPRGGRVKAKVRLHDTIKNLNRHQRPHLVRFKGDGTGTRVGWELH